MKIAIGFSSQNKNQVSKILDFFHSNRQIQVTEFDSDGGLVCKKLAEFEGNKILIITDNFLKSEECMFGGLDLISKGQDELLIFIGEGMDENSNPIPTTLSKVTHIIKYINFWQDKYLELRREKSWDESENDTHLQKIRTISTEVGEFIRLLRGVNLIELDSEISGGFINLRNFLNLSFSDVEIIGEGEIQNEISDETEIQDEVEIAQEEEVYVGGENYIENSENVEVEVTQEQEVNSGWEGNEDEGVNIFEQSENAEEVGKQEQEESIEEDILKEIHEEEINQEEWIKLAEEQIQAGNFGDAESLLKRAEFNSSHDSRILFKLSMLYFQHFKNDLELSLQYIDRAIHLEENNSDLFFQRALIKEALDHELNSIELDLNKAIEIDPNHTLANYQLAIIKKKQGHLNDARNLYLKSVQLNGEFKSVQNDLAFGISKSKGEVNEIIEDLRKQIDHLQKIIDFREVPVQEKTVLITGATSGIGRATAIKFALSGYRKIIITGRRKNLLQELRDEISKSSNSEVIELCFDITNRDEVIKALEGLPPIDVLVNNAGKAKGLAPIHEGSFEHWDEMIKTNISGLLYVTKMISQQMVERKSGHIVNVGSTAGKEVYPNGNVYCASKFAVDALTKSMRLDLYQHNIRVSQISPGHVEQTEFAKVRFDGDEERAKIYEGFNPLTSNDVAEMIFYIVNQPLRINIQDMVVMGTQQAGATFIDRSGRKF